MTLEQIDTARAKGWALFGCNNVFQIVPDLEVHYAVNLNWWDHYWSEIKDHPCEKWTTNKDAAYKYGLHHIRERNAPGLSDDPTIVHHGHGSGYTLVNLAFLKGATRIYLLGYDLKYSPDYDGKAHRTGTKPRHYFGEYPESMQHWPSVQVKQGVHVELVELYRSIHEQGWVDIYNCSPDSALEGVIPSACLESK